VRLLKENAFIVSLIVAVVVVGGILVVMQRSASADADSGAKVRIDRSEDMNRLAAAPVNRLTVDAAIAREDAMRDEAAKVAADFLRSNRKDYKIIAFALPNKTVPAFPIDKEVYTREDLRLLFPREYDKRVKALLASLKPARPPTAEEIQAEQERVAAALAATPATGAPTGVAPSPTPRPVPTGTTFLPSGSYGLRGGTRRPPPTGGPRTGLQAATQPAKTPEQRAVDKLIRTCAHRGLVYADEQSMDPIMIPGSSMRYSDSQLWMAQVSLWVQKDVVAAIVAANEEVRRRAAVGQKGVPASAVRHLKAIKVIGYVVQDAGGPGLGAEGGGTQGVGGMYGMGGTTGGITGVGGASNRLVYVGQAPSLQQVSPERLSRRVCDTSYDVVQYEFTVVIPFRYLPKLYRKLLERQYHTILKVQVGESTTTQQPGMNTAGVGQAATAQEYYYYGTDPVVQVTLTGELLLAAEWTRGRWDEKTDAWDKAYPALMPDAFLAAIQRYDASALRPEDAKRASAVMLAGPGYGTFP